MVTRRGFGSAFGVLFVYIVAIESQELVLLGWCAMS